MTAMPFRIFVVDDEDVARDGITLALRKQYRMHSYPTAEDAIQAMLEDPPDLVLLDIGLPGMSGIEVLREVISPLPMRVTSPPVRTKRRPAFRRWRSTGEPWKRIDAR